MQQILPLFSYQTRPRKFEVQFLLHIAQLPLILQSKYLLFNLNRQDKELQCH